MTPEVAKNLAQWDQREADVAAFFGAMSDDTLWRVLDRTYASLGSDDLAMPKAVAKLALTTLMLSASKEMLRRMAEAESNN